MAWPTQASSYPYTHDTVPNCCASGLTGHVWNTANGDWNSAGTWKTGTSAGTTTGEAALGRVPISTDRVSIASGTTVTISTTNAVCKALSVVPGATLHFDPTVNTKLTVETIYNHGTWQQGIPGTPISSSKTSLIEFANVAFDDSNDPNNWWQGFLNDATKYVQGETKTPYMRLAAAPIAGATTLTLESSVTNWRAGDNLFLPDSGSIIQTTGFEFATILSISGTTITLTAPLAYAHPGCTVPSVAATNGITYPGSTNEAHGVFLPHVANTTRNVKWYSADRTGIRGHRVSFDEAQDSEYYVELFAMGRTTLDWFPDNLPLSRKGRYSYHQHHTCGPVTTTLASGMQGDLYGCALWDTSTDQGVRWHVTYHSSAYQYCAYNVVLNATGWGIGTEENSGRGHKFHYNFVANVPGTGNRGDARKTGDATHVQDMGVDGACYWWSDCCDHEFVGNIGTSSQFGWLVNQDGQPQTVVVPAFQGANPHMNPGDGETRSIFQNHIVRCEDNEFYGHALSVAFDIWIIGAAYSAFSATIPRSILLRTTFWNSGDKGFFPYPISNYTMDSWRVYSGKAASRNNQCGLLLSDYLCANCEVIRCDFRGLELGIGVPQKTGDLQNNPETAQGLFTATDNYIECWQGVSRSQLSATTGGGLAISARKGVFRNNVMILVPGSGDAPVNAPHYWQDFIPLGIDFEVACNFRQLDEMFVYSHQGDPSKNYKVYDFTQTPHGYNMPRGDVFECGTPEAGRDNTYLLANYGVCCLGEIFPVTARDGQSEGFYAVLDDLTPGPATPSVSGPASSILQGQTLALAASNFTGGAVTWASNHTGTATVNASTGVVTGQPHHQSSNQVATITATGVANGAQTATFDVTVSKVDVTINPPVATVANSGTLQFAATVVGSTTTTVTWSVSGGGSINSSTGLYTAPSTNTAGITVTATSAGDTSRTGTAAVTSSSPQTGGLTPHRVSRFRRPG